MPNSSKDHNTGKPKTPLTEPNRNKLTAGGKKKLRTGPAILVAAAFVGPGTVLVASKAGAQFGYSLLWAVVFSVIAAVVLQEMAARLGIVTKSGLAESIKTSIPNSSTRTSAIILVLSAILLGNCAFQTGNITGAAAGLELLSPLSPRSWSTIIAIIAAAIVIVGRADILKGFLTFLVASMGALFVYAAIMSKPDLGAISAGLIPGIPTGSEWLLIALIGTTVVSYNLFLHASSAAEFWGDTKDTQRSIRLSLFDTIVSVSIGGIITAAILITAAVTFGGGHEISNVSEVALQLEPTLGKWAERAFAVGLLAAGLTSSITAPIAAAFATAGCFGWEPKLSNVKLKAVALGVIAIGLTFAFAYGESPAQTIVFAQVANGLLLPIIVMFLLYTVNQTKVLGEFKNKLFANFFGVAILLVTLVIAFRNFRGAWKGIQKLLGE